MKRGILVVGEALWDLRATRGASLANASTVDLVPGGGALNAASTLVELGYRVSLACTVGDDAVGRALLTRAAARGIDVKASRTAKPRTGVAFIELAPGGDRKVVAYRSPFEEVPPWPSRRFVAILASGVAPNWRFKAEARKAREGGAFVAVDLNARFGVFRDRKSRACLGLLRGAHLIKASRDDLGVLGLDVAALRQRTRRDALLVITDGGKPALAFGPFGQLTVPVPRPAANADPTAAGDTFFAALVDALLEHRDDTVGAIHRAHLAARDRIDDSAPQKRKPPASGRKRGARG